MITDVLYKNIFKPVLFRFDPEDVHQGFTKLGMLLGNHTATRAVTRSLFYYQHPSLKTTVAGITFQNPVGLAAGFDKNAKLYNILREVGFGFAELGSITGEPCQGNPRPRLFRVPKDKSILVNYGLYNNGSLAISKRLSHTQFRIPIGFSVAKTNDPSLSTQQGITDYVKAYGRMHPLGAYTTVNVSCPNTADGQTFGHPDNLSLLLKALAHENHVKPVFLKIKPDMSPSQLREVISIVEKQEWVTGYVISNLTLHREGLHTSKQVLDAMSLKGGLSGKAMAEKSTKTIQFVRKHTNKIILGCGGIFTGQDAYEKIKSGAALVQLVTSLIYEGPGVVSNINRELIDLLHANGYGRLSELVEEVRE